MRITYIVKYNQQIMSSEYSSDKELIEVMKNDSELEKLYDMVTKNSSLINKYLLDTVISRFTLNISKIIELEKRMSKQQ